MKTKNGKWIAASLCGLNCERSAAMEKSIIIILACSIIAIVFAAMFSRARRMLESWAEENDYQIISSELRWLRRGPFFWTTSKNQVVYYVTVRDQDTVMRKGWVRCGSWWWGVLQDKTEVRWNERQM